MMFSQSAAFKRLKDQKPVDLPSVLSPERIQKMVLRGVGFDLFYATERVSSEILDDLYALASEMHVLGKNKADGGGGADQSH